MKEIIAVWAIAALLLAGSAEAAEKMQVEVVEASSMISKTLLITNFAKVILPDGSHAMLMCFAGDGHCAKIEPVSPEKMSPDSTNCDKLVPSQMTCVTTNLGRYEAERKGNQLTIRAPNGKLKFKIVGSW
jgi:hypothetical protein